MARRAAPALYELMRRPGAAGNATPAANAASAASAGRRAGTAPSIPSTFEISLGRLVIIGVALVIVIAIAYGIGVRRGSSVTAPKAVVGTTEVVETQLPPSNSPKVPPIIGKSEGTAPKGTNPAAPALADKNSDPRVKGLRYFVLAHPSSDRATELVDFCRANGLEAYLVSDDNSLSRKIIVTPGYRDASEKSSPEIKQLEAKIKSVGEKWKRTSRGNFNFSDAFPAVYR